MNSLSLALCGFILWLGMISPVFSGDEGVLKIPFSVPVKPLTPVSEEDESLYRQIVKVFGSAQSPFETERPDAPIFSDFALSAPGLFFSNDHEATSQKIIASEFTRLLANGQTERVWQHCLSLRWIASRIDLFAPVCKAAGQKIDEQTPREPSPGANITIPAEPETTVALNAYLRNPYSAEGLRKLLVLIREDHVEKLVPLLKEMAQLDEQYLWSRTKGSKSLGDWALYSIEKSLANLNP